MEQTLQCLDNGLLLRLPSSRDIFHQRHLYLRLWTRSRHRRDYIMTRISTCHESQSRTLRSEPYPSTNWRHMQRLGLFDCKSLHWHCKSPNRNTIMESTGARPQAWYCCLSWIPRSIGSELETTMSSNEPWPLRLVAFHEVCCLLKRGK